MHKTLKLYEKNEIKQIETKKYSCPKVRYGRKFVSSFMTIIYTKYNPGLLLLENEITFNKNESLTTMCSQFMSWTSLSFLQEELSMYVSCQFINQSLILLMIFVNA